MDTLREQYEHLEYERFPPGIVAWRLGVGPDGMDRCYGRIELGLLAKPHVAESTAPGEAGISMDTRREQYEHLECERFPPGIVAWRLGEGPDGLDRCDGMIELGLLAKPHVAKSTAPGEA